MPERSNQHAAIIMEALTEVLAVPQRYADQDGPAPRWRRQVRAHDRNDQQTSESIPVAVNAATSANGFQDLLDILDREAVIDRQEEPGSGRIVRGRRAYLG